jgi:hypothetical protein
MKEKCRGARQCLGEFGDGHRRFHRTRHAEQRRQDGLRRPQRDVQGAAAKFCRVKGSTWVLI